MYSQAEDNVLNWAEHEYNPQLGHSTSNDGTLPQEQELLESENLVCLGMV